MTISIRKNKLTSTTKLYRFFMP